jgi:SAM-dependent methyltransferase
MHDAYGTTSFQAYWLGGQYFARVIADLVLEHHAKPNRLLEWGCGPARIIRHLPGLLPNAAIFGADYNPQSVNWCSAAFPEIKFVKNDLAPPLPFEQRFFDLIYAISVFTHISPDQQKAWAKELVRLLTASGLLIFTINGDRAAHTLLPHEQARYAANGVAVC